MQSLHESTCGWHGTVWPPKSACMNTPSYIIQGTIIKHFPLNSNKIQTNKKQYNMIMTNILQKQKQKARRFLNFHVHFLWCCHIMLHCFHLLYRFFFSTNTFHCSFCFVCLCVCVFFFCFLFCLSS